ncbi:MULTISPECIES: DUF397 domain-containing protein [unclassified Streptomyces]|uniref:DUF397 domain-containing protein n=1 Tax=unclassified Streptomyces TaxID=2593676 RepID=UPI000DAD6BD1|nr:MULTISPECIES: DUF397 domain-containing protein [unclassified Streptomyces]PZT76636.1 DUF397 domain-containing protein [Streptomyces sp. AC1-42W]PZT79407.1 DUF397 domain-containing protein [Streptomyces sp. AC1-42T]
MSSTHGPRPDQWVKSTYSDGNGGQCIEWAPEHAAATGDYLVRDSKNPEGPCLTLTADQWAGLVTFARKNG